MDRRVSRILAAALAAIMAMTMASVPVLAADFRSGGDVNVASGEVVNNDLYLSGGTLNIDGTVNGDLLAVGGTINLNGTVDGAVMVAGGTVNINGKVTHGVRAAGGTVNVNGAVGGDLVVAGGTVVISGKAIIGRDLIFAAGNTSAAGPVEGNVRGIASELVLSNRVKGNVEVTAESLTLSPSANLQGNLIYISQNDAVVQAGARIAGTTHHNFPPPRHTGPLSDAGGRILSLLMALAAGLIATMIVPRRLEASADLIRSGPWVSLGWGAIILVGVPIAAIIVLATVVGLPLALIGMGFWGMTLYLSQLPSGLIIGRSIFRQVGKRKTKTLLFAALASGLLILEILKAIPVLGFIVTLAAILFGMGAIVISARRQAVTLAAPPSATAVQPPPPPAA